MPERWLFSVSVTVLLLLWCCSAHAKLPINVDLEMTFPETDDIQSYKPHFNVADDNHKQQEPSDSVQGMHKVPTN